MDIVISNKIDKPIYEQIYDQLASQILRGELVADFCLPSIRNIALEIGVSIITVKKAWEMLERDGFIYTRAGKGCFVAEHTAKKLDDKKLGLACDKLDVDVPYYKSLGLTYEELCILIKKRY